ncbi:23S rRNA (guanosine(2251)-2'-O)-methyltransferase RlmB [Inquilinus sp. Marseille-Q2685]|uniref:23S rRNA (guanosine(2251)-2'-O)-methyltransferase RlmB n=1 Tax=Inquilinus sp. Marseille-Q2685 TaxID=2866581 RepID=UPI001CE40D7C|nr:23S rRNA (guanosine(2251)-2'-O)-methyltransferase RlmB [Inquilinus sp. Marseille-Q2685]
MTRTPQNRPPRAAPPHGPRPGPYQGQRPDQRGPGGRPPAGRPPAREPDRYLYGVHAAVAAILNPERVITRVQCTEAGLANLSEALAEAAQAGLDRPQPEIVDRALMDRFLKGAVHQGIALEIKPLEAPDIDDIGRQASLREPEGEPGAAARSIVVVLDQVTDPHNIGAILRSAAAFGALAVVVTDRHAPEITGVMAKTASGAVEHVPLVRVKNLARALESLGQWGFRRIGLAEEGEATLAEAMQGDKVALVLGAEGEGLRHLTRETCDVLARLPTQGPIGSLNVSNAAAIALYEAARN